MIPIKYFWTGFSPTTDEIYEAMEITHKENCMVIIKWQAFGYPYSMTVQSHMSFEDCENQIPKVYGM
jgi:hypothetical protein